MKTFLVPLLFAISIPTANIDLSRTGANSNELLLTPSNVNPASFKKLGAWPVDGYIFSQPLYAPGVVTSGQTHDLVIVATLNNSVYAFDANVPGTGAVWSNLHFAGTNSGYPVNEPSLYGQPLGCLSTPVIDTSAQVLYVVCENSTPNWILRQLDLRTGATLQTATISGQVVGTGDVGHGDTTSGANLLFFPNQQFQRTGLALANGNVYFGFASLTDSRPWHGWIMAYRTSDFTQVGIWCSTPNGFGGGVWQSGGGAAIDGAGNLFITTGNGTTYDGITNFTNSVMKLSPTLSPVDWFTPSNNAAINAADADVSSNRIILAGGKAIIAAKDFNVYSLDPNCLGHLQGSSGCSLQTFPTDSGGTPGSSSGSYGGMFFDQALYLPTTAGSLYRFSFSSGSFSTSPTLLSGTGWAFAGPAQITGSSNQGTNGVVWIVTCNASTHSATQAGTLRALDPSTLSEIWNSDSAGGRDSLGLISKFAAPTVVGGRVFVATQGSQLISYGLINSSQLTGVATMAGQAVLQ